jgi:pyruvate/2-oxoglutarate dehydrogenase complex dihydrolipoamide dehydrogenase (E3) component
VDVKTLFGVSVTVRTTSREQEIEGSDTLVAAGRIPNPAGIGLEKIGVELDDRGYTRVNEWLETTASGVWAMGECAGSRHFTHAFVDDESAPRAIGWFHIACSRTLHSPTWD